MTIESETSLLPDGGQVSSPVRTTNNHPVVPALAGPFPENLSRHSLEDAEIKERIKDFPRWHYQFNLKGNLTPIFDERHAIRHEERKRYFFEPAVQLAGGSLRGKRVLDLGCNAGFWSLAAIEAGCDFVLGIDGRQMHIDQANFVFEVNEVEQSRYQFIGSNIFELDLAQFGPFDLVLYLGLMYHISKPVELLEKIAQVNSDILVIDTTLSLAPGTYLELRHDKLDEPRDAVDYELVMWPTKQAVFDMVRQFGYSAVVLKPQFRNYTGAPDYRFRARRAFLCAKHSSMTHVSYPVEPMNLRNRSTDALLWSVQKLVPILPRIAAR